MGFSVSIILASAAFPFGALLLGFVAAFGLILSAEPPAMVALSVGLLLVPLVVGGLLGRALDLANDPKTSLYSGLVSLFVAGWCFELLLQERLWGRMIELAVAPSAASLIAFGSGLVLLGSSAAFVVCVLVLLVELPIAWWFGARKSSLTTLVVRPFLPWVLWCFGATLVVDLLSHELGAW